jgi:hypothetical protein
MCDRKDCGSHTTEISLKVHFERNHPDPRIPGPVG